MFGLLVTSAYKRTVFEEPIVIDHSLDTFNVYEVFNSGKRQVVNIIKRPLMQSDYKDLRFCINPLGTAAQKRYLPYKIVSSDALGAVIDVSFPTTPSVSDTYYCIWGNASVTAMSNGYDTYSTCGGYYNDMSRGGSGLWWDVGKYYGSDKQPFTDAFWPAAAGSPFNNQTAIGVYKSSGGDDVHGGTDNTYVAFVKTTDRGKTWSGETNIFPRIFNVTLNRYIIFMNATCTWVDDGSPAGLITVIANSNVSITLVAGTAPVLADQQEYSRPYITQSSDGGATWTPPAILVDTNDYCGMGGSATVTHDGLQLFFGHCDFPIDAGDPFAYCFYSFDNFVTVGVEIFEEANAYLNETTCLQLKDAGGAWTNQVLMITRDDSDSNHIVPPPNAQKWRTETLTYNIGLETVSISAPALNSFTTPLKSRPNLCRYRMGYGRPDRIVCMGGTTVIPAWYSDNENVSWTNFAVNGTANVVADGGGYVPGAGRTYPAQVAFHQTGSQTDLGMLLWNQNGEASDVYVTFFDPLLFNLRTTSTTTYTDAIPRPVAGDNGMKVSYHDTGAQSDPKTLSAEWWFVNGNVTPITMYARAKAKGAVNAVIGFKKLGEAGSTFANVIAIHKQSNTVYARQASDTGGLATVTQTDDVNYNWRIDWTPDFVKFYQNDILKATKTPAMGSGIPNWSGCPYVNMRDNGAVTDYVDFDYMYVVPYGDFTSLEVNYGTTAWNYNDNGII